MTARTEWWRLRKRMLILLLAIGAGGTYKLWCYGEATYGPIDMNQLFDVLPLSPAAMDAQWDMSQSGTITDQDPMIEKEGHEIIFGAKEQHVRRLAAPFPLAIDLTFRYYATDCAAKDGWEYVTGLMTAGAMPFPVAADQAGMSCSIEDRQESYSTDARRSKVRRCWTELRYGNYGMSYSFSVAPSPAGDALFVETVQKLDRHTIDVLKSTSKN